MDSRYWGWKWLWYKLINCLYGRFKRLILWIEGTEDKNDLDINWSTAYMDFKRLILWIDEDENDLDINWSTAYMGDLKDLYYGFKVLRMNMT